jgi:LmbE family N-acetylglucosaminyl deacetylase
MLHLIPEIPKGQPLRLLCIGAHSDDIEIGCGGTVLTWLADMPAIEVTWAVLSAEGVRANEARRSAKALLARAKKREVIVADFRDCLMQSQYLEIKQHFENLRKHCSPDVILTHWLGDRHQDHRLVSELTWNTWRNHLILEYEIPKYEGDLVPTNIFVPVSKSIAQRKVSHLSRHFFSQSSKDWFGADTFLGLMRLRGLECRSASGFAEAFHGRKLTI